METQAYLNFMHTLAAHARGITLAHFRQTFAMESKPDCSPVTEVDKATEAALRELIQKQYPTHGIIGEEMPSINPQAEYVWVIDPIDGTRSFISGSPLFCTLVALLRRGQAVVGMIDTPALNQRWLGVCDDSNNERGAWHYELQGESAEQQEGQPCRVQAASDLSQAIMITTTIGIYDDSKLLRLLKAARYQQLGGDAFAYACVASGYAHIAADTAMQPHDYLPLIPIIQGAGGTITTWQGKSLEQTDAAAYTEQQVLATTSESLHHQALAQLK